MIDLPLIDDYRDRYEPALGSEANSDVRQKIPCAYILENAIDSQDCAALTPDIWLPASM
jgi:hypothetical protein